MNGKDAETTEIQDLFVNILGGNNATPGALKRAAELTGSSSLAHRIKATGILAAAGDRMEKESAWAKLTQIVLEHGGGVG